MFDKAAEHLKVPKVTFTNYLLYRTRSGKFPGAVYVQPIGKDGWFARVERNGTLTLNPRQPCEGLEAELSLLAQDPVGFTAEYGRRSGSCCFCHTTLTNPLSLSVGYGPICAGRYGLPYPSKKELAEKTKAEELERNLSQCWSDNLYYRDFCGRKQQYTEGVRTLAIGGNCYWLLDAIASYQPAAMSDAMMRDFQIWTLTVNDDKSALLVGSRDTNDPMFRQEIPCTDFPLPFIKLYLENDVLCLARER